MFLGVVISALSAMAAAGQADICSYAPAPVRAAYVHFPPRSDEPLLRSWLEINPGECQAMEPSVDGRYFFYAEVKKGNLVADYLGISNTAWLEKNGRSLGTIVCVPDFPVPGYDAEICRRSDRKIGFVEFNSTGGDNVELTLDGRTWSKIGIEPNSRASAREIANSLGVVAKYAQILENESVGAPFKLGLELGSYNGYVVVHGTIPGMPGELVLQRGDLIAEVNGQRIRSPQEFTKEIQKFGFSTAPSKRSGLMTFVRNDERFQVPIVPCKTEDDFCLHHVASLDPRAYYNHGAAVRRGIFGGVLWGFDGEFYCIYKQAEGKNFADSKFRDFDDCTKSLRYERDILNETNPDQMGSADLLGSMTSPRFLLRAAAKNKARRSIARIAVGAIDEGLQGVVSYRGHLDSWSDFEASRALEEFKSNLLIGAATGAVTGY